METRESADSPLRRVPFTLEGGQVGQALSNRYQAWVWVVASSALRRHSTGRLTDFNFGLIEV
jgi:hypothetical protein